MQEGKTSQTYYNEFNYPSSELKRWYKLLNYKIKQYFKNK